MTGPIDGLLYFQLAGVIVPTVSVIMLFVRLGALLRTIQQLEHDMKKMAGAVQSVSVVATELVAWRDATKSNQADVLERVRRLEDLELSHRKAVK